MRKSFVLLLCVYSSVYAESRPLAPVIDNSTYSKGSSAKPSNNAMYEIFGRLEQMQLELQQLRGLVEEQSQTIRELEKRQNNIYSDLDNRMQEASSYNNKTRSRVSALGGARNTGVSGVAQDKERHAVSSNNRMTNRRFPEDKNIAKTPVTAPPLANVPKRVDKVSNKPEPVDNQKKMYFSAYEMLRNGHNTKAIEKFKGLLNEYPDGKYASKSQYWLGEAYKVTNNISAAKRAFAKVISHYGRSPKVPDALLKLGYIELEQNNKVSARDYLTKISVSYPDSTAAHLAKKKLLQMETLGP
ncbi:MAG: tol-pal system protein YbgF [Methylococcaceae bacterium]